MASPITFVDVTTSAGNLSFSHTVPSGGSRLLLVITGSHNNEGGENDNVTGITYGGVALTQAERQSGAWRLLTMYYLVNPSVGTDTIVVSGTDISGAIAIAALNFTNVNQDTPVRTTAKTSGTNLSPSLTLASSVENDLVVEGAVFQSSGTSSAFAPGASQTELADFRSGSGGWALGISFKEGAASVNVSTTASGMADSNGAMVAISLEPDEVQSIEEDIGLSDAVDAWKNPDGISDTAGISDAVTAGFSLQAGVSENLTVNDTVDATRELGKAVSDSLTVNDTVDASGGYQKGVADTAGISDAVDTQTEYKPSLPENFTFADIVDAILNNPLRRKQIPLKLQGTHVTLRFRNNAATQSLSLVDIGIKRERLVGMTRSKSVQIKLTGGHIRLRFRNNTLSESLKLEYMGAKIEGYMAR